MVKDVFMIRITLWLMLLLNALFIWTEFLENVFPLAVIKCLDTLDNVRLPLTILEFLAISVLFVDLVIRFDRINAKRRNMHILGVGICVTGFMFKIFIYYLSSAYMN